MAKLLPLSDFQRLAPERQAGLLAEFRDRMLRRRTVRHFSDEPVPFELIRGAVEVAASAPSGANLQPWRFVVVSDPEVKHQIRIAAEAEERQNYEARFPPEYLAALEPFATDWHKPFLETAPYLIVVFRIDYGLDAGRPGQKIKHYFVNESVGIATGFLLAALQIAGLVCLTHTPSPMGFLAKILKRPANERPFLLIPVGYPAQDATVPDISKKNVDEILIHEANH